MVAYKAGTEQNVNLVLNTIKKAKKKTKLTPIKNGISLLLKI